MKAYLEKQMQASKFKPTWHVKAMLTEIGNAISQATANLAKASEQVKTSLPRESKLIQNWNELL